MKRLVLCCERGRTVTGGLCRAGLSRGWRLGFWRLHQARGWGE
jgi:hypothetical protein